MSRLQDRPTTGAPAGPDDPLVIQAVEEYLAELEAGCRPDRQRLLARHPDLADMLTECLDSLDLVFTARPGLRPLGVADDGEETPPAAALGDFQILRELGRGGMGVVYEAVQRSLGRRVALKVLPFAAALDLKQMQRFKNEAQAAALLHHTNIVPVFGVGCERGVHYYAMQLIEGQSLAALIHRLRQPDSMTTQADSSGSAVVLRPRPHPEPTSPATPPGDTAKGPAGNLSTERTTQRDSFVRRVAQLGLKAAEALEHAHQLGIVHRDVKPANLLLDVRGNLWVTDFGLALFPSGPGLTMTGEVLGTLRYMSPEQALGRRGVVDHRTDIFSLGATLYELLTLRPAFDGQDRAELLRQIAEGEPLPLRRHDPAVPRALETIVLKALAKSPADRYGTAQELADDLQRFLDDKPILARRPTLPERAARWARRHRPVVASALVLLLMAVVGLAVTTVAVSREQAATEAAYERERQQAKRAEESFRLAQEQRARAEENFRRAEQSFRQAWAAVDLFTHIGEEELADLSFLQGMRRRLLEASLGYYQDFIDRRSDDPSIQAELVASHERVKKLLGELSVLQGLGQMSLLRDEAVQKDLKLSWAQRSQVKQRAALLDEQWRTAFQGFRQFSSENRRKQALELALATEKAVAEVLKPEQARRFKQVLLQVQQRNPHGFTDQEIVQGLKLTAKQKEKIRGILHEAYLAPWMHGHADGARGKVRKSAGEFWLIVHDKIVKVLTAEQRERWRELAGEPVACEARLLSPGRPRPPVGPPGRPDRRPPL
jgi:serine/threonine protein kinase